MDDDFIDELWEEFDDIFEEHLDEELHEEELPDEWCLAFVEKYGENELDKLFNFLEEKGINDLHAMNVGYTEDNSPIIFDYSGFFENTDY